jgi:hypothetical protein
VLSELLARPDPGEHEQLGRVEDAARQDNLTRGTGLTPFARLLAWLFVSLIQALTFEVLHPDRTIILVEKNPGGECIEFNREVIRVLSLDLKQAFACTKAAMVARQ